MEYDIIKREIKINKYKNHLDNLALEFIGILSKYTEYVIISGYVSILLGRSRATEDIDVFIKPLKKDRFNELLNELDKNNYWCINAENDDEIFQYLEDGLAIRFAKKNTAVPNFELKYPKNQVDKDTFDDSLTVILPKGKLIISSLERQVAFKRYYLQSDKDIEDALHIEVIFGDILDNEKINKLKKIIDKIKENESR